MTATQAPTPGPLDSESVTLLVKGDLLLCKTWGVVRFDRFDDSGVRAFVLDLANDQVRLMKPINMAFIGRPDADGWMPWSGGENPVPGQRVEVRLRNGRQYEDYLSEGWAADKTGPEDYWKHGNDPYLQQLEIIAFRLAPTAPVEASGSEVPDGMMTIADELEDKADELDQMDARGQIWGLEDVSDIMRRAATALRPQPSGETLRLDRLRDWINREVPAGTESATWWVRQIDAALSTTRARAEAQDEGEPVAWEIVSYDIYPGACWIAPHKADEYRKEYGCTLRPLYAHPSPTPAADADRVRAEINAGDDNAAYASERIAAAKEGEE